MNDSDLSEQLLGCVSKIRRVLDDRLRRHGVSVSRKRVLGALTQGPLRQGALAEAFDVTPRTITELVDGLVNDGYVERRTDPKDRRARLVSLTPAGRAANTEAMDTREQTLAELFSDLSDEQRDTFSHILGVISSRLSSMAPVLDEQPAPGREAVPLDPLSMAVETETGA